MEAVEYAKENPGYAADLYIRKTNAPRDLADKFVTTITWTPSGRGTGQDLMLAVSNSHQFRKELGGVPSNIEVKVEQTVDVRFLP